MVKHCLLALTLAATLYAVAPAAIAQDNGSNSQAPAGAPPDHGRGGHFDPARRTEMLTKQLKLSSDQQAKVLEILKSQQSQMESLRSDTSTPQADRRSKMMEIHKASDDQIRAVLDANQQKKFDQMQSNHEQWQGRHEGGQRPAAAPDSAPQQ